VDQSDATFLYYRSTNRVFADIGAYRTDAVNLASSGAAGPGAARRVEAVRASASLFGVLGVAPRLGRAFRADEDLPGAAPVVILSESLWRRQYGADPDILGREVLIDGVAHAVVGVMPAAFAVPDAGAALWLPIGIDPARTATAAFIFQAVGRLRPGITADSAAAALQTLLPRVPDAYPGRLTSAAIGLTHMRAVVRPLLESTVGGAGRMLWVVFGAAAALLLIVCANVANLFLVRGEERQHDLVVRRALGAGRGAIVTEFVAEAALLSVLGSVLGLALARVSIAVLRAQGAGVAIPRLADVGLDGAVLALVGAVAVFTALAVSVVPAIRACGPNVAGALARTGTRVSAGHERHRARRALVVVQVALALVLVTSAGLLARTFNRLRAVPSGIAADRGYTFRLSLPPVSYPTTGSVVELVARAVDALKALPGVRAVGVLTKLPFDEEMRRDTAVFVADRPRGMGQLPVIHQVDYVTPDAFGALGTPLLEGRTVEPPDAGRAPLEVVITKALARRYWGDSSALGRRLSLDPAGPLFTVVGVTGDVRGAGLDQPPDQTVFLPLVTAPGPATADGGEGPARWAPRDLAFVIRSDAGARNVLVPVERTLRALAPTVPLYAARSLEEVVAQSTARTSITLTLLEVASLAALLIGAVGLYAVVSYMVSLRAREIAMRMALGAEPGALLRQVLAQAMGVAGVGIALGLGATLLV
ncbi:MAG TPA: ABC transporter permease, partial [Gemmatimonadales bacterium]